MENATVVGTLHFVIDGEWVTNLVRDWFWGKESKPYVVCEEILLNCLVNDSVSLAKRKQIAQEIIEGKKKLVGENELRVVEDGECIRPIADKLDELSKQLEIEKIRNDIIYNAIDYIDVYSTYKSSAFAREYADIFTREECEKYFLYDGQNGDGGPLYDTGKQCFVDDLFARGGLWILDYPEQIYEAMKYAEVQSSNICSSEKYWEKIYELFKDFGGLRERNENYLAAVRVKELKRQRENGGVPIQSTFDVNKTKAKEFSAFRLENIEFIKKRMENMPTFENEVINELMRHSLRLVKSELEDATREDREILEYCIKPDDYQTWEGVIAPNGDFYSCDFAGHNMKAYNLISIFPEKFPNVDYDWFARNCDCTNALDELLEQGWCATRCLNNCFIELPTKNMGKITKAQENAIFDAKYKHEVGVDLSPIGY